MIGFRNFSIFSNCWFFYSGHDIDKVILHPSYDSDNQNFDFALLILKDPIKFSNKANAACVSSDATELYSGLDLIVSGWGNLAATGHNDEFPDWLQVKN